MLSRAAHKGYLLKDTPSRRLHDELRRITQGETPLSGLMATKVFKEYGRSGNTAQPLAECAEPLTEREHQILKLLVEGHSNVEIAEKVYLSENTVKKHVRNILEKFHSKNRVEAAVYAVRERLVD
jgi:DNA-binding NarL/FixJ family response regulator